MTSMGIKRANGHADIAELVRPDPVSRLGPVSCEMRHAGEKFVVAFGMFEADGHAAGLPLQRVMGVDAEVDQHLLQLVAVANDPQRASFQGV